MNTKTSIPKPIRRSALRKRAGKQFYRLKRRIKWLRESKNYASTTVIDSLSHLIFEHKSMLLRPLQGVDMIYQKNKITNLSLAISKINGLVIQPGEVFSLWYLVGNPTASRGYLPGLVLESGKVSYGVGGGLCQLGNLLYWMVLHTDLEVVERWRHGYDVFPDVNRKIPFGAGATLAFNHVDLMLRNNSKNATQIKLWLTETHLHGAIYSDTPKKASYEVIEKNHQFTQEWWGSYVRHNEIWRVAKTGEDERTEELVTQNHAIMMYNPLIQASGEAT